MYQSAPDAPDFIIKKNKRQNKTTGNFSQTRKKGYTSESQPNMGQKEMLYIGKNDLGNGTYDVEIFNLISGELVITAKHCQKMDNFVIQIAPDKAD